MRVSRLAALSIIGISSLGALIPGAAASAAMRPTVSPLVTCSGAGCNGQSASGTGCSSSAITAETANIAGYGQVQLRYSTVCLTAWAKVISNAGSGASAEVNRSDGLFYSCSGLNCITAMVYDHPYTSFGLGEIVVNGVGHTATTSSY